MQIGKIFGLVVFAAGAVVLAGCSTSETLAEGIADKNISGSGAFVKHKIGLDADKTPTMESIVITGNYQSVKSGANFASYERTETAAWYNANNRTIQERFIVSLAPEGDLPGALDKISRQVNAAAEAEKPL